MTQTVLKGLERIKYHSRERTVKNGTCASVRLIEGVTVSNCVNLFDLIKEELYNRLIDSVQQYIFFTFTYRTSRSGRDGITKGKIRLFYFYFCRRACPLSSTFTSESVFLMKFLVASLERFCFEVIYVFLKLFFYRSLFLPV